MKNELNNIIKKNKTLSNLWDDFEYPNSAIIEVSKRQEKDMEQRIKFKLWSSTSQIL